MPALNNFPMVSQRDNNVNADFDCVPASISACIQYLTGQAIDPGAIKDQVYGAGYIGGTAASAYVDYCAARGVRLAPVDGSGSDLVNAIKSAISAGHPCLITEPDPYMPAQDGYSHVCAAYAYDSGSITVMDPWIDQAVTKSDADWSAQLEFNQIWEVSMTVPTGWRDDGTTLTAPNGHKLSQGFRAWVLDHSWDPGNEPNEEEYSAYPVQLHAPQFGGGDRVTLRDTVLWWTSGKGVIQEPYPGLEIKAAYDLISQQQAKIASLQAQLQAINAPINPDVAAQIQTALTALQTAQKELPPNA